jgi:hypothetical protein
MKNKYKKVLPPIAVAPFWAIGFIKYSNELYTLFFLLVIGLIAGVITSKLVN